MPMFKSKIYKNAYIFLILIVSLWTVGCSSVPQKDIVDIDNVLTEKQKNEARAQAKVAQDAKITQSSQAQTAALKPITVPSPIVYPKESTANQEAAENA